MLDDVPRYDDVNRACEATQCVGIEIPSFNSRAGRAHPTPGRVVTDRRRDPAAGPFEQLVEELALTASDLDHADLRSVGDEVQDAAGHGGPMGRKRRRVALIVLVAVMVIDERRLEGTLEHEAPIGACHDLASSCGG